MNQQDTHTARTGNELPPRNAVVPPRNAVLPPRNAVELCGIVTVDSAMLVNGVVTLSPHQWPFLENASDMSGYWTHYRRALGVDCITPKTQDFMPAPLGSVD